jgi:hypothetical protein
MKISRWNQDLWLLRVHQPFILHGQLFGKPVRVHGMLVCLPAEFVSGQVIFLAMGDGRSRVGMGG